MNTQIEVRQLRALLAVVEEGTFTDAAIALFYSIRIPNSTVNDIHNTRSYEEENYIRKVPEGLIMVERLNLSSLTPSSLLDLVFVCRWVPYGKQLSLLSK